MTTEKIWLRIIHINDVYELDNYPSFKSLVDEKKNEADKTLIMLAGDFVAPSLLSSLDKGRGMVDTMNMCGFTHVCFGNHETDISSNDLVQRILQSNFVWLNTNMRELDDKLDIDTEPHDIVEIIHGEYSKKVAFLGLLTEDPFLYRPGSFGNAKIEPVLDVTESYMREKMPKDVDLVVPLTHQRMAEDRAFANKFGTDIFPIIIGGHDHDPYDETHNNSRIIKTGYDGINTAITDICWSIEGGKVAEKPSIKIEMIPTSTYPPDPEVESRVRGHEKILKELEKAKIFRFEDWKMKLKLDSHFSTKGNRLGFSTGCHVLCTMIRMGMRCQLCLINAGSIRGNREYNDEIEWFTWSDLKTEIPYPTLMTAKYVPGRVIEETITYSRRGIRMDPKESSGRYLHHCSNVVYSNETMKIKTIQGEPFDPDKLYLTAFLGQCAHGMDNHIPFLEWVKESNIFVDMEAAKPAKLVLVEMFAALLWLEMGSFHEIDKDGDGLLTRNEVRERAVSVFGDEVADLVVESIMNVADRDHKGAISPLEMMVVSYVAIDMIDHVCTDDELKVMKNVVCEVIDTRPSHADVSGFVEQLFGVMDTGGDGKISRGEVLQAVGKVRRQTLLR